MAPPSRFGRRLFRLLLRAYPLRFRERFAADLLEAFERDRARPQFSGLRGGIRFWRHAIVDTVRTAWSERRDGRRLSDGRLTISREGTKPSWSTVAGSLLQDARLGCRRLWHRPGFTALAVLTLALGIGANTAVFGIVHAVLLRPLPYPDSDRLAILTQQQGRSETFPQLAYLDFEDIRQQSPDFESLSAILIDSFVVRGPQGPVRVNGLSVTPGFFATLGVRPVLGRDLRGGTASAAASPIAVVSDRFWREHLGDDPAIVERSILLDGEAHTVVGVLPQAFDFELPVTASFGIEDVQVFRPLDVSAPMARNRSVFTFEVLGRVKPGTTWLRAQTGLDTIAARLEAAYPATNANRRFGIVPLHEQVVGRVQPALLALLAATGLVLLLAASNLGGLLLAQATSRHRELSIRAALGASRGRLLRQLTVESLLLAALGGAAGLLLAVSVQQTLVRLPGIQLPRVEEIGLSPAVMTAGIGMVVVTALAAGLLQAAALRPAGGGPGNGVRATAGRFAARLRSSIVAAEIAVASVLLLGSTLLLVSLSHVLNIAPGFDSNRLLSMRVTLTDSRYETWPQVRAVYQELASRIGALPGVERVTMSGSLPLSGHSTGTAVRIEWRPLLAGEQPPSVRWQTVFPGYFDTMGIPVIRGRDFTEAEQNHVNHQTIISQSMARALFPDQDAIGRRVQFGPERDQPDWHEVIGVAGDVRHGHLEADPQPHAYDLYGQHNGLSQFVIVRSERDPGLLVPAVRRIARELDPDAPVYSIATLEELRASSVAPRRYLAVLVACYAGLASLLFLVGIYGVLAESVARRTRELGVRMALGARPSHVGRLVVRQGVTLAIIGLVIGFSAMAVLGRLLDALLYGVAPSDPRTYSGVALAVIGVVLLACWIPARRAMRADPIVVLRVE